MKIKVTAVALALACCTAYAQDETFDPRSLAMGGTGVTTSNPGNAAFHNAAMLASAKNSHEDDFALEFPVLGIRLLDENQLVSTLIPQLNTNANNLTNALTAFQAAVAGGNAAAIQASAGTAGTALSAFNNSLSSVSQKSMAGNAFAGTVLAVPSKKHAFSLYLDGRAEVGGQFNYAGPDRTTIGNLSTALTQCGAGNAASCITAGGLVGPGGQINGLQSQLQVRGVIAKDIGIAAAGHFDTLGDIDIGIVPKLTQYATYDFAMGVQGGNNKISLNQGQKNYSAFNVDLGTAKTFETENGNQVKAGLAIKDLMSKSFTTVLGNTISVKPHVTAGASYETQLTTSGIDVDLVTNHSLLAGMVKDSQFVRLGTEFNAWSWAQIRLGYRHDLKHNYVGLPSVGVGLSPFGIHFEISAAYASKKEAALSLQAGSRF